MKTTETLAEIASQLPYGSKKVITDRTNLNYRTVDNILKGKKANVSNVIKVMKEAKRIILEIKEASDFNL